MMVDYLEPAHIANEVYQFKPDIVGISSVAPEADVMHQVAAEIRKVSQCKTVAGGPYVSSCPEMVLHDPNIDYIVIGEGEYAFAELVEAILSDRDVSHIEGIGYRSKGYFQRTQPREYIHDLDNVPFPAWDLIKYKEYGKHWRGNILQPRRTYMALMTSRGCPYQCIYCHKVLGKKFRARSPENVYAEIKTLYSVYSIRDFEILDDVFNLDKDRAMRICDLIIDSGIKVNLSFAAGLRGDLMDEELLDKLHRAGAYQISYAVETASSRLQTYIQKNIDLHKIERIIEKTYDRGITTWGFFMLGFPTETEEEMEETGRFALRAKLDMASFFIVTPLPDTRLRQIAETTGKNTDISSRESSFWYGNSNLSSVEDRKLYVFQRNFFVKFYINPKRVFRYFRLFSKFPHKRVILTYCILFIAKTFFSINRSQKWHRLLYKLKPL